MRSPIILKNGFLYTNISGENIHEKRIPQDGVQQATAASLFLPSCLARQENLIMAKGNSETPLMAQHKQIKAKYPDAILLFRVGDFYETFGQDAIVASGVLGITLTKRKSLILYFE